MTTLEESRFSDLELGPDLEVIASQVVESKKKLGKPVPTEANLATAITHLSIADTIVGSSTLTIKVYDQDWVLMESGFFDANKDGRLDKIDLNYPEDSDFWWRLTQVGLAGDEIVEMTFMERAAVHMMSHIGPLKASRAKRTRAEFIQMLTSKVKVGGGIKLISRELKKVQEVDPEAIKEEKKEKAKKDEEDRKEKKDPGISSSEKITFTNWDGAKYTFKSGELKNAETALDEAGDISEKAALALLCAIIVEAPFCRNPVGGHDSSVGILQLLNIHLGGSVEARRNIPKVVRLFLDKGFTDGQGAIAKAKAHSDWTPGKIAQSCQGSAYPERYDKVLDGAEQILEAYGGAGAGGSSGNSSRRKQYNFEVGSVENPRETYWDAAVRLAEEVKWPLFLNGQTAYYDSEITLIKQKPIAIIDRDDAAVIDFSCNWDVRQIATEMELDLICDPFEFRAGQVFKLSGFGPASTGSTVKLPGRWLIQDIERDRSSLYSSFTLKQPERPLPEPVSELADEPGGGGEGGDVKGKLFEACKEISDENRGYSQATIRVFSKIPDKAPIDCSNSCCWALKRAGMYEGSSAMVSGGMASGWGKPGRGKEWTVWANASHVFIQSEGGGKKWRFDTGGGPPPGPHIRDGHRSTGGFTPRHWEGE